MMGMLFLLLLQTPSVPQPLWRALTERATPWYVAEAGATDQMGVSSRARLVFRLHQRLDPGDTDRTTDFWSVLFFESETPHEGETQIVQRWADARTCPAVTAALESMPDFNRATPYALDDLATQTSRAPYPHRPTYTFRAVGSISPGGPRVGLNYDDLTGQVMQPWFGSTITAIKPCLTDAEPALANSTVDR